MIYITDHAKFWKKGSVKENVFNNTIRAFSKLKGSISRVESEKGLSASLLINT